MGNYASNNQSAHGNKQVTNKSTKVCTLYILFKSLLTFFFFFCNYDRYTCICV